jgi:acyl-CoA synthetase (AMP-forming)/AMP-acid ligase II
MSANFYAHIAPTLQAQPRQELLRWPVNDSGPATTYTGADLAGRVAAVRQALDQRGVQPGQRVLLLVPVSIELMAALLGVLAHGAVVVLPPAGLRPRQLPGLVRQARLAAAIVLQPPGWLPRGLARLLGLRLLAMQGLPAASITPTLPPAAVPGTQAALVTHTSGSTGQPKQIVRTHAVLSAQHAVLKAVFPPWLGQRDCPLFPNVLLHNLAAGVVSVVPAIPWADLPALNPAAVVQQLAAEQVQTLTGNVFYFERLLPLLQAQARELSAVRALGIGGSPVPETLVQALRAALPAATVYVIYGSSEAEPIAVRAVTEAAANPALGYAVGPVVAGLELRLAPLGELALPNGQRPTAGEILVRGAHVAGTDPEGWLHTGDFGYLAPDGQLWLTGRQGNETLQLGVQHYQVEHVVQHLPGVERVAARPGARGFVLYVQGTVAEETVRAALAAAFPAGICEAVHFRAALPVDRRHHSKIRYAELG